MTPNAIPGSPGVSDLRATLKAETAREHEQTEALFAPYDLSDNAGYRRFLRAHARVLAPIEQAVGAASLWNGWSPRLPLLRSDLDALGETPPALTTLALDATEAALWGMLYVVEGSRLGGAVLAARVGGDMPRRYLAEKPAHGHWRAFLAALEEAGQAGDAAWRAQAVQGAHNAFALFGEAARNGLDRAYAVA